MKPSLLSLSYDGISIVTSFFIGLSRDYSLHLSSPHDSFLSSIRLPIFTPFISPSHQSISLDSIDAILFPFYSFLFSFHCPSKSFYSLVCSSLVPQGSHPLQSRYTHKTPPPFFHAFPIIPFYSSVSIVSSSLFLYKSV